MVKCVQTYECKMAHRFIGRSYWFLLDWKRCANVNGGFSPTDLLIAPTRFARGAISLILDKATKKSNLNRLENIPVSNVSYERLAKDRGGPYESSVGDYHIGLYQETF